MTDLPADTRTRFCKGVMLVGAVSLAFCVHSALAGSSQTTGPATASGLEAALRSTLSQHPAVAGKRAEVAAKGYAGDTARAQRYPSLSAQATANDNNTRPVATLRARQPLWAFGRIDAGIAYADADKAVDEADLLRVQRQLIDQTAVAYVRVLGARSRLAVAEDNVASLNALSEQIRRRHQGQLASLADVRLAEARLIQARAQRDRYAGELSVAENDLQALTQTPVQAVGAIPSSITQLPASSDIEALAVDQSTDMRLKAERVALARSDVDREKVATMPTVYLQGDRFFNQTGSAANMVMGLTIEASIDGLGFASKGRGEAAGARLIAAQEDLKASRMEVVRTVRSLLANRDLQQGLLDGQNLSVAELKELLASYQRQYQAGSKAWMDVLNMQRELTEQRLQAAQAESDWLMYTLKLAALTGRLDALAFSISKD